MSFPVDTGFLVFNDRTYPRLVQLFAELGVASVASEMSFSCRIDRARLEWSGTNVAALFAQPRSALRPAFWRMLADILRFNRAATALHASGDVWSVSLGEYLEAEAYSAPFRDWYLLPMAAAIWSSPRRDILEFPLPAFVRFCLSLVRYQANRVVLHTDPALLPRARRAWSAWNGHVVDDPDGARPVAVSYLINKLQPLPCRTPVIVTLNPAVEPSPSCVLREFEYAHPLLDEQSLCAQQLFGQLQGDRHTWFAGAWLGYGFHEDGLASAHAVADGIGKMSARHQVGGIAAPIAA